MWRNIFALFILWTLFDMTDFILRLLVLFRISSFMYERKWNLRINKGPSADGSKERDIYLDVQLIQSSI